MTTGTRCKVLGTRGGLLAALALVTACGTEGRAGTLATVRPDRSRATREPHYRRNAWSRQCESRRYTFGVDVQYAVTVPATLAAPSTAFYAAVLAGNRAFVLKRTADTSVIVATLNFTVADGQDCTVYAIGGASNSAITGFVTTDDNPVAAANQTRLRVVT